MFNREILPVNPQHFVSIVGDRILKSTQKDIVLRTKKWKLSKLIEGKNEFEKLKINYGALKPLLDPYWNIDNQDFSAYKANFDQLVFAIDHFWANVLHYQLDAFLNGQDFIFDLDPCQTLFISGELIVIDIEPRFVSQWWMGADIVEKSTYFLSSTLSEDIPNSFSHLKSLFHKTNRFMFPRATVVADEVIEKLGLKFNNPFKDLK